MHKAVKPDTATNSGVVQLVLNVLRRAGKDEIADELEKSSTKLVQSELHYYELLAEKDLEISMLKSRLENANNMVKSYMTEFEQRGLAYVPKTAVNGNIQHEK